MRLREAGEGAPKIRARLENLALHTQGFLIPRDLNYMRERTRVRGDRSVSFLAAKLGTAFDIKPILHCNRGETGPVGKVKNFDNAAQKLFEHAVRRVERNELMTPTMCVSFGGELDELHALPGYELAAPGLRREQRRTVRDGDEPDQHGQHRQGRTRAGLRRGDRQDRTVTRSA